MRNAAMAYASSASTDVAAHGGCPSRHVPAARNLTATTNDESYHGSARELPPATSHGYAEWDFSGVPDLVMFQRFLDAADSWFSYSDDSSAGSYDPARECFVVVVDDQANGANAGAGDGEAPQSPGTGLLQGAGPSAPPPRQQGRRHQRAASLRTSNSYVASTLMKDFQALFVIYAPNTLVGCTNVSFHQD
jgi:hypothetical protein